MHRKSISEKIKALRKEYEEWQHYVERKHEEPFKRRDDETLVQIALSVYTNQIRDINKKNKK